MSSLNCVDTGPPPEKVTPFALDTRTGQSVGPDDRQSFIAHATAERKSIRAGITPMVRQRLGRSLTNEFGSWLTRITAGAPARHQRDVLINILRTLARAKRKSIRRKRCRHAAYSSTTPGSQIVKTKPKYISQGRKRPSSKLAYKPQPMVQMEFAFELPDLNRQQNTEFPR